MSAEDEDRTAGVSTIPVTGNLFRRSRNPHGFIIQVFVSRGSKRPASAPANTATNADALTLSKKVDGQEVFQVNDKKEAEESLSGFIKADNPPKPEFPLNTGVNLNESIKVEVTLDENGNILKANAAPAGELLLRQAAEKAARQTKFTVPKISMQIVKITGVIAYNFAKDKTVTVAPQLENVRTEVKPNKFHSSVKALIERLKNNQSQPTADEAKFVRDGKADLVVRLRELKPEIVAELKTLGFEVQSVMASANAVVGKIAPEKLAALEALESVTFISPQTR